MNPTPTEALTQLGKHLQQQAEDDRRFESGVDTIGFVYVTQVEGICLTLGQSFPTQSPEGEFLREVIRQAKENRRFESGIDQIGFVYCDQLAEIIQEAIKKRSVSV